MKNFQIFYCLCLVGTATLLSLQQPAQASEKLSTQAADLLAQATESAASPIKITGVRLNPTEAGLEVILQTAQGATLQPEPRGNSNTTFFSEVPNAVLALPEGNEFRAENPAKGIQSITVKQLDGNVVQVQAVGQAELPTVIVKTEQSPVANEPDTGEEEVVVTGDRTPYFTPNAVSGTRTDTPLRDIPQSIQVIPKEVLRDQQVTSFDEALRNVSSVTATNFAGVFTDFSIRGFSGAPLFRDGFRQYEFFQSVPETANLEQIEVLKGPASILFGEVQPGGVINAVSKKPLSEPFYAGELQIGSNEFYRTHLDLSGPLTQDKSLLYRVNALFKTDDGFRGYEQNKQRLFIAPSLAWKINDRTDFTVNLEYINDRNPFDAGLLAVGNRVIDVPRDSITNEPDDNSKQTFLSVGYTLEHRLNDNWKLRNAFRFAKQNYFSDFYFPVFFDEASGTVGRAFITRDIDVRSYTVQTSAEGKFATGSVEHKLLVGVDLNRQTSKFFGGIDPSGPTFIDIFNPIYGVNPRPNPDDLPTLVDQDITQSRLGIFVQDQISLLKNLKLLVGIRYDTVEERLIRNPNAFNPNTFKTTQNDNAFTPRVGIVYQPIDPISLYASYSQSFNPGAGNTFAGDLLPPERGQGWEVGLKAELIKSKLFATVSYYDITKQNVATEDPENPSFSIATGEQHSRGVEFDLTGEILPGWNIIASYGYTDATVTKDEDIIAGSRLVGIPKHSASLWTTYTVPKGRLKGFGVGIGFNYVGDRSGALNSKTAPENTFQLDSYFLTNAAIYYKRDNYRLALNFKNLFNVNYISASNLGSRLSGIEPGAPLTVIGSVSVEF